MPHFSAAAFQYDCNLSLSSFQQTTKHTGTAANIYCRAAETKRYNTHCTTMIDDGSLFTRLSVTKCLERAFRILQHHVGFFLPIGLVAAVPIVALTAMMMSVTNSLMGTADAAAGTAGAYDPYAPPQDLDLPKGALVAFLILTPLWCVVSLVGTGAMIRGTAEVYAGETPKLLPCLQEGFRRACTLFQFGLMLFLGLFVASFVLGIVFGILSIFAGENAHILVMVLSIPVSFFMTFYVMISFQMTPPTIVLERRTAYEAMERSWALMDGSRCYVFCALLLLMVVGVVVGLIAGILGPLGLALHFGWAVIATPLGTM